MKTAFGIAHQTSANAAPSSLSHQRRYRVTPYGQRVLTAALTLHDDQFPDSYLAA